MTLTKRKTRKIQELPDENEENPDERHDSVSGGLSEKLPIGDSESSLSSIESSEDDAPRKRKRVVRQKSSSAKISPPAKTGSKRQAEHGTLKKTSAAKNKRKKIAETQEDECGEIETDTSKENKKEVKPATRTRRKQNVEAQEDESGETETGTSKDIKKEVKPAAKTKRKQNLEAEADECSETETGTSKNVKKAMKPATKSMRKQNLETQENELGETQTGSSKEIKKTVKPAMKTRRKQILEKHENECSEIETSTSKDTEEEMKSEPDKTASSSKKSKDSVSKGREKVSKTVLKKGQTIESLKSSMKHRLTSKQYSKYFGAHVSAAGGVENAILNSAMISGESFGLFLKNQRKWDSQDMTSESISNFASFSVECDMDCYNYALPHGSYLINLANPDEQINLKSYNCLLEDLKRCHTLNIKRYNLHPGSSLGKCTTNEGISNIASAINRCHKEVPEVVIIIENMSGAKNIIGSCFEDLRDIVANVDDKDRIGVCLDTCHLFAAGYDVRTKESFDKVLTDFDSIVGLRFLQAMHLNDSKGEFDSKKDRHAHLGEGHIGWECFEFIARDPRFKNIPMILETPDEAKWEGEIDKLYKFCVMDPPAAN